MIIDVSDLISQSDAARIRNVSRQAITHLINRGRFDVVLIAGYYLVKKSQVESFEKMKPGRKFKTVEQFTSGKL